MIFEELKKLYFRRRHFQTKIPKCYIEFTTECFRIFRIKYAMEWVRMTKQFATNIIRQVKYCIVHFYKCALNREKFGLDEDFYSHILIQWARKHFSRIPINLSLVHWDGNGMLFTLPLGLQQVFCNKPWMIEGCYIHAKRIVWLSHYSLNFRGWA